MQTISSESTLLKQALIAMEQIRGYVDGLPAWALADVYHRLDAITIRNEDASDALDVLRQDIIAAARANKLS